MDRKSTQFAHLPYQPHPGSFMATCARRFCTISLYAIAFLLIVFTMPLSLIVAAVVDIAKKTSWVCVRTILFLALYFGFELYAVVVLFGIWLFSGVWAGGNVQRYYRWNFWIQHWWGDSVVRASMRLFSIRLEVEERYAFGERPIIVFIRHASMTDTPLSAVLISRKYRIHLRYVLKRELLWDPALDLSFNSLPNCFVRRDSPASKAEIERVARLMDDLGPWEGVLIYPEGTRFTEEKKARILEKMRAAGNEEGVRRVESFRRVLPPRPGGPLKLLERNRGADAVFFAHTGLEKSTSIIDLFNGGVVGKTVKIKIWGVPFEEIPKDKAEQEAWLYEQWRKVDDFVVEHIEE